MSEKTELQAIIGARDVAMTSLRQQNKEFLEQLMAKEATIQKISLAADAMRENYESVLKANDAENERLRIGHSDSVASLALAARELAEKEAMIGDLKRAHHEAASQLREKENVLQLLHSQLQDRDVLLEKLATTHGEALREHAAALDRLEQQISSLLPLHAAAAAPAAPIGSPDMMRALEEKEACIRELNDALVAYRAAYPAIAIVSRPLRAVSGARRGLARLVRRIVVPKLGNLNQHAPVDLAIPASYAAQPLPERTPRISIVTPSYMQATFIERTIDSVVAQGYPELEYFVQDGGSDDGTRAILERRATELTGWESQRDGGQSEAINLGFAKTSGEIMAWLNSDDLLLPGSLAYVADYFNRHPEVDVVYGHRLLIDENDKQIGRWVMPAHDDRILSWADFVPQETLFWRRSIWEKTGGKIDESFRFAMDWDLLLRMRGAGARFVRLPRAIGAFRIHTQQKTSAEISDVGFTEMSRLRERALGKMPSSVQINAALVPYLLKHLCADFFWQFGARKWQTRVVQ